MDTKKHVYVTVNGREVEYLAISTSAMQMSRRGLEKAYRERGEQLDPPVYTSKTASGAEMVDPHDATTPKTEEEQIAWDIYIDAQKRMTAENTELVMRYILDDGLANIQLPEDASWQDKYKARYIDMPTDLVELRDFYIDKEVLTTRADIEGLTSSVLLLSEYGKVDPDALEARLEFFRGRMEKKRRQPRNAAQGTDGPEKQVEPQPEANGN